MCVSWIWCLIFTRCVKRGPEGEGGEGGQDGVVGMEVGMGVGILKANVGGGVGLRDSG